MLPEMHYGCSSRLFSKNPVWLKQLYVLPRDLFYKVKASVALHYKAVCVLHNK